MANATTAFGFRPVKEPDPSSLMTVVLLASYATDVFVGDVVVPAGSGEVINGYMSVQQAAAGNANSLGVIVGFEPSSPDALTSRYGAASTLRYAKIVPTWQSTIFEVMANAAIANTDLGNGFDLAVAAGSTTTGFSGMTLDVSSAATTGTTLRALGFANRPDNDFSTNNTGIKCYVFFAESIWNNGAGA